MRLTSYTQKLASRFMAGLTVMLITALLVALSACGQVDAGNASSQLVQTKDQSSEKANVLILLFDDMRFDTFSYRGGPVATPNIDALAADSTRFDNAMTTTGLCSPSRAALFTGRWGHKTGLDDNIGLYHSRLSEMALSEGGLIKRASNAGYNVGYVGKWHLGPQGVDLRGANYTWGKEHKAERHTRQWTPYEKVDKREQYARGERDANKEKHEYFQTLPGTYDETPAAEKVRAGQAMIKKAANDKRPFFGVVSFSQPHPPYRVPEPYASMFDPKKLKLPKNHLSKRVNKPLAQEEILWPWHDVTHMTDDDWLQTRAHYYGAIAMIDRAVGELIQSAKDAGIYDDLHIVLAGDQGSMLGEHGLYDKGPYAYDELMRMPLLIRNPKAEPSIISRQVSMMDIAPTLADAMGLQNDGDVDGRVLTDLMFKGDAADKARADTALYAYEWYNGAWYGIRAIRTPDMKFVWNPGDSRDELYDLKTDPVEINNVLDEPDYAEQQQRMVELLASELKRIDDPLLEKFLSHIEVGDKISVH